MDLFAAERAHAILCTLGENKREGVVNVVARQTRRDRQAILAPLAFLTRWTFNILFFVYDRQSLADVLEKIVVERAGIDGALIGFTRHAPILNSFQRNAHAEP